MGENICEFHEFFATMRKARGISLSKMAEGLYSESMMKRIEQGERVPDRLSRNLILARLGVSMESLGEFLQPDEYRDYCTQEEILNGLKKKEFSTVTKRVTQILGTLNEGQKVYKQFCYDILARVASYEGDHEKSRDYCLKAVKETCSCETDFAIDSKILAPQEIYYIVTYLIEKAECENTYDELLISYQNIFRYLDNSKMDDLAIAKVYPMAVFGLFRVIEQTEGKYNTELDIESIYDKAIDVLRKKRRTYYLTEIVQYSRGILGKKSETCNSKKRIVDEKWLGAIEEARTFFSYTKERKLDGYIYVGPRAEPVGDVIRRRRKLFCLSQKDLAEGICDTKTVMRIEHGKCRVQREILDLLLQKLNLQLGFVRLPVVTNNSEDLELYYKMINAINQLSVVHQEETLYEFSTRINLNNPNNDQLVCRYRYTIQRRKGSISNEEYIDLMKKNLSKTVPFNLLKQCPGGYLTRKEMGALYNLANASYRSRVADWKNLLGILCRQTDRSFLSDNEPKIRDTGDQLILLWIASVFGDEKEYDESNKLSRHIAKWELEENRVSGTHKCIYNEVWNKAKTKEINLEKADKMINLCITLAEFAMDYNDLKHYKRKKNLIEEKDAMWYEH